MKQLLVALFSIPLLFFSVVASADKVIISGEPIIVKQEADVYIPASVVTTRDYYYFTFDNTQRVCYQEIQPALTNIDAGIFSVRIGDAVVKVHCYDYNPEYFVIE